MPGLFRSAVIKLTAAYTAIIVGLCMIFSFVLYRLAVTELHAGFYSQYNRWFTAYEPFGLRSPVAPTQELAARSHNIMMQLMYFNILVLVIASVACYLLARRTLRPIEAAHEQQKRFTADVSHELRTPLTALRMESEVSLADPRAGTPQLRATLTSNLEEVGRMEALINSLLVLSQMEANKFRTEFRRLNAREVVQDALASVSKAADSKQLYFDLDLHDAFVRGDSASLAQLYVILLENAIKYSPGNATIKVAIRRGRTRHRVEISDRGPGIPVKNLPHIFDRFYQADDSRTRPAGDAGQQGFGLGLSIAKQIADVHNGEIIITSGVGKGTRVSVLLPVSYK